MIKNLIFITTALLASTVVTGCESISEDQCAAANWLERGYKDGVNGKSPDRVSDYADTCAKYGFSINSAKYLSGHADGLQFYCTYEKGFVLGEGGNPYNPVCAGDLATDFAQGYDAGRDVYAVYQEHENLIGSYSATLDDLLGIQSRLTEENLTPEDVKRLSRKERRTERKLDELRIDIRAHERLHDLPRHKF